jgi:predicted nucleotidyltransferase
MTRVQTKEPIIEYLRSHREHLHREYRIRKIALIGSFARDEQHEESDVDLLIDLEENTPHIFELKQMLKNELEAKFGRSVEVASERYLKPYYRDQILEDAIYV